MKAALPSNATNRAKYWHTPDEEVNVIERDRKARAANLARYIRIREQGGELFPKGDSDE